MQQGPCLFHEQAENKTSEEQGSSASPETSDNVVPDFMERVTAPSFIYIFNYFPFAFSCIFFISCEIIP